MTEPKQHHYVPKCYSSNFTNQDGYLYVKDTWTDRIFPAKPIDALKEGFLYRQPVHAEKRFDNAIEKFFSRTVESSWPYIVERVHQYTELDKETWSKLITFMYAMRVRVPNTMKAVTQLLRDLVCKISDKMDQPIPEEITQIFRAKYPDFDGKVNFSDLVRAGIISIPIDPHTALLSFEKLIRSNDSALMIGEKPRFIHNMTNLNFISSDNPAIFHIFKRDLLSIKPYSFSKIDNNELIFPISSKTILLMRTDHNKITQHENTYSENTVRKINEKISIYSDRYIFGASEKSLKEVPGYPNLCPIPNFERSKVGNGLVYKIDYEFGSPLKFRNKWKYDFEQAQQS